MRGVAAGAILGGSSAGDEGGAVMNDGKQWPGPVRALAAHLASKGERVATARQVSDRRGSRAWHVTSTCGQFALKANAEGLCSARDKRSELNREVRVIAELGRLDAIPVDYLVASGTWDGGRWLAVKWAPGEPMWHAFAVSRDKDVSDSRRFVITCTRSMASAMASMHRVQWVHADIQPTNTLVTEDGSATLIDYALACGPVVQGSPDLEADRSPYLGALTHTTAPEIASALLNTAETVHVPATAAADVWALGATLFWCWTGHRPVPYGEPDGPRAGKLRDIAEGNLLDVAEVRPWAFPRFEEAITACLHPAPDKRPTATELLDFVGEPER
ncbi:protein kinase [Streptomyces pathocidini]|uniref:Protein kinase n=1 Tax=Streptomyces pathocidini TaxID=1650571 RepID=A0ABW7UXI1_9ACTN|nr:protein kinase [Streptomyces pathocidini]